MEKVLRRFRFTSLKTGGTVVEEYDGSPSEFIAVKATEGLIIVTYYQIYKGKETK